MGESPVFRKTRDFCFMDKKYTIQCPFCDKNIILTISQKYEPSDAEKEIRKRTKGFLDEIQRLRIKLKRLEMHSVN